MSKLNSIHEVNINNVVNKISAVGILGNIALTIFKLLAGISANSAAMISDAVHSLSDVFATVIALVGVKFSKREPDKEHPYGHDRFESLASIILALILVITGISIGYSGIDKVLNYDTHNIVVPGKIALVAAIVSILAKETMFWYTLYYAKKIDSQAFIADAWHHRSDALSSVGSFIGIGLSLLGYPIFDPIASIVISILILKVGYDIFKGGLGNMMDKSCSDEVEEEIRKITLEDSDIMNIDVLRTREFGSNMFIDIEIMVDGGLSLKEAHDISERLHDRVESHFSKCKHCMVHVNPSEC